MILRRDDDEIAVENRRFDHRVSRDAQHEGSRMAREVGWDDELALAVLGRRDRRAGGNLADDGEHPDLGNDGTLETTGRDQGAWFGRIALNETTSLK